MLTLYGSTTSPYVRRIRVLLADKEHSFVNMDIFSKEGRQQLALKNPTLKIPMLEDDGQILFDSRIIARYLSQQLDLAPLSWEQENLLTLIDAANDSLVQMLILQRSGLDVEGDLMYLRVQQQRVQGLLSHLEQLVADGAFATWHYPAICLYCLLDWAEFRQMADLQPYSQLLAFQQAHKNKIALTATDPRSC